MPVIDLGSVVGPQGPQGTDGATGAQGIQGNPGPNQVTDQTSTNLNGVLFGNQSRVTVKPVDSDPTANSTNLVSSGGTDKAIKGRVPVYGLGKNLLDNWYFVKGTGQPYPVNQRGQTQYTGEGWCIDRWYLKGSGSTLDVGANGITLTAGSSGILQLVHGLVGGHQAILDEKTVVFSIKASSVSGNCRISIVKASSISSNISTIETKSFSSAGVHTVTAAIDRAGANRINYLIQADANSVITVEAVKLELGTEQTLCHNEGTAEAPVWVLNEIPDYGEELRKCQRYFLRIGKFSSSSNAMPIGSLTTAGATNAADYVVSLPTTMRNATPSLTYSGTITIYKADGSSNVTVSNLVLNTAYCSNISLHMTATFSPTVTKGTLMGSMILSGSGYVDISCDL